MKNKFEEIKFELKKTFFGIDEQIDQVIKAFETWESVKDYQVRPMTVCLWGLTGTGKTALINKAIELLSLDKKKFYVKFGSKTSGLDDDLEQNNCEDTIFILDEFQYFKTKKECGDEIERNEDNSTNVIWELLDGGIINLYGLTGSGFYSYEKYQMMSALYALKNLDSIGAKLSHGIISHLELEKHLRSMHIPLDKKYEIEEYDDVEPYDQDCVCEVRNKDFSKTEILLKSLIDVNWHNFYEYAKGRDIDYVFHSKQEFFDFINNTLTLEELIKFIQLLIDAKPKLVTKNYSKSLIFVIGNLDECFTMSNDLSSDLDADYFYNRTKSITIVDIRKSLLKRFRSEQIARLGSTHIIYPSLNKNAFKEIINKELNSFKDVVFSKFGENVCDVTFSEKIKELIYKEGVFPVIGARSIFSTINEIISEKFTYIIEQMLEFKDEKDLKISFDYDKKKTLIIIKFNNAKDELISSCDLKYNIKVDQLRSEKNKGKQAHRAVHEAGHAVCSIILDHTFPEVVYSVVLDSKTSGFNLFKGEDMYYYRKNTYINKIATNLAGYAAEEMIFDKENISNGSSSDIHQATTLLSTLFKECGFLDGKIGEYVSKSFTSSMFETSNYSITDEDNSIEDFVQQKLNIGLDIAKKVLCEEHILFLKISEYLVKNPKITNKKLKELTKKYAVTINKDDLNKNKEQFYYDMLNNELNKL